MENPDAALSPRGKERPADGVQVRGIRGRADIREFQQKDKQVMNRSGDIAMNLKSAVAIAGPALILAGTPVRAHHAFAAEFDAKKPVHLEGVISKVELINPHAWIHVDVKAPDGKVTTWMIEAGSPNVLLRRGLTKAAVPIGTQVVVDGYQSK